MCWAGIAADELAAAERHLAASLAGSGNLEAALKLLGDVRLCYNSAPPSLPGQASNQSSPMTTAQEYLNTALERSVLLLAKTVMCPGEAS